MPSIQKNSGGFKIEASRVFYILFIYALLISFMLPASYNPQVRTRG